MSETEHGSASESSSQHEDVRFRIIHLLYLIAVIASCLATFGIGGIVLALFITGFWGVVFAGRSRPRQPRRMIAAFSDPDTLP